MIEHHRRKSHVDRLRRRKLGDGWAKPRNVRALGQFPFSHYPPDDNFLAAYANAYLMEALVVIPERHVKLFKNGRNQTVRIPREFELPGDDAIMRKEGNRLVIEPSAPKSLLAILATLEPLDEEFPPIADQIPDPIEF